VTGWARTLGSAVACGTVASVVSTVSLGLLARAEGKGALKPINATGHWLNGDQAGSFTRADIAHTVVGYATHHAVTVFWAVLFERWIESHRPLAALPTLQHALATSVVAAAVDYGPTTRRFTPEWEFVLTKRSMAAAYGAMAVGIAVGALMMQRGPHVRSERTAMRAGCVKMSYRNSNWQSFLLSNASA